jgi:hypothetical protein
MASRNPQVLPQVLALPALRLHIQEAAVLTALKSAIVLVRQNQELL